MHRGQLGTLCASCHVARRLEDHPHRARRADAEVRGRARPRAVRVVPPGRAAARRHGQLVHHVPSQRRHPPQRARAALRRVPHAADVGGGALRAHARRLRADRRAPHAAVRGLPRRRQLHGAGVELLRLPRQGSRSRGDGSAAIGSRRDHSAFTTCASCHNTIFFGPDDDRRSRGSASRCADEAARCSRSSLRARCRRWRTRRI